MRIPLLDLSVEENLETVFEMCEINFERDAMPAAEVNYNQGAWASRRTH